MDHTTHNAIINFIWGIADDVLRDVYGRGRYRDVILPMTVLRRLDCLLEPTKEEVLKQYQRLQEQNNSDLSGESSIEMPYGWSRVSEVQNNPDLSELTKVTGYPFYNISRFTLRQLLDEPNRQLESSLLDYLNGFSENVQEINNRFRLWNQIETLAENRRLKGLIEKFLSDKINLSPDPVKDEDGTVIHEGLSNLGMGYVFEELIRRFNEENNEEAGEHFTPRDIIRLMVNLVFLPIKDQIEDGTYRVYDCACGSGGMLTEAEAFLHELAEQTGKTLELELYGQEINQETYAICQADLLIKGEDPQRIFCGSTLSQDAFPDMKFDFMLANPPYGKSWKMDKEELEEGRGKNRQVTDARFIVDHPRLSPNERLELLPRVSDGQLLFLVNKLSKMEWDKPLGSRIAIVHNGSALFTGDAGQGESNIRQWIIENDWLECIIGLPQNMFYNTGIATYIWVLTNRKAAHRKGKVQLIDATEWYNKLRRNLGQKNCELTVADIQRITEAFLTFEETPQSKIFDNADFGYHKIVVERPLRLAFKVTLERIEKFKELADSELHGLVEIVSELFGDECHKDFNQVKAAFDKCLKAKGIKIKAKDLKLVYDCFTQKDESAERVILKQTKEGIVYEPDVELRDTENVLLKEKISNFFEREVLPYAPDTWIAHEKTLRGYEISFIKYFYKFKPLRSLEEIAQDIFILEDEADGLLHEIIREQGIEQ